MQTSAYEHFNDTRLHTVDGRIYVLVGYTLYKEGASHFTAAVMWRSGGFMMD